MPELVSRVRALLRPAERGVGGAAGAGQPGAGYADRETTVAGATLALPARETSLLEMLLRRAERVVAREAIEQGLYGFDAPTGSNAVEVRCIGCGAGCKKRRRAARPHGAGRRLHAHRRNHRAGAVMAPCGAARLAAGRGDVGRDRARRGGIAWRTLATIHSLDDAALQSPGAAGRGPYPRARQTGAGVRLPAELAAVFRNPTARASIRLRRRTRRCSAPTRKRR